MPLKMKKTFLMFVDGLRACANVLPAPMRERVEDSRNPFAPASPSDFRRLTVAPLWRICGEEGRRRAIACGNVRPRPAPRVCKSWHCEGLWPIPDYLRECPCARTRPRRIPMRAALIVVARVARLVCPASWADRPSLAAPKRRAMRYGARPFPCDTAETPS